MEVKMPENAGVFSESESAGVFRILTWSEEDFESSVAMVNKLPPENRVHFLDQKYKP